MHPTEEPVRALAPRLRELRQTRWRKLTQSELAQALGCSEALISSWEKHVVPPVARLEDYATFFATRRSVERERARLLDVGDLSPAEATERERLLTELVELRDTAVGTPSAGRGPWRFPDPEDDRPIVIVCPELPAEVTAKIPLADESNLDYSELFRLSDLDSLLELYGHIRAVNPNHRVEYRRVGNMRRDDSTGHLVVLGGVDWNPTQRTLMERIPAPVVQRSEDDPLDRGCFQVVADKTQSFSPRWEQIDGRRTLVEDVGYFFRGPNPFNRARTVTLCNGMFGRGVLGAVRTLTDKQLRDRNAKYLDEHFGSKTSYSILFRVPIIDQRVVVTPDWTAPKSVLHAWSE